MRGEQAAPDHERRLLCWHCRAPFVQKGPGRSKVVCDSPRCQRARRLYQKRGLAALDRVPA